jgi:uncharacterized protein (DUF305 family)
MRLGGDPTHSGRLSGAVRYAAAALSLVAAAIHLWVAPEHFEKWWGYGIFFLAAAVFQGAYGPAVLRWPQPWLLYLGIAVNLGVIVLWLATRTVGVPLLGPHAGVVEDVGALDLAATTAELALVFVVAAGLLSLSTRRDTAFAADVLHPEHRSGERTLIPVLALAVVALLGLSVWLYLSGRPPADDSAEAGFARDMAVHHAQAVEMAEIVRDRTEDPEVRTLATDIALTQQAQIGQMQGWLSVWGLPPTGTGPAMAWMGHETQGTMPGMASPEEVSRLSELPPEKADVLFLQLMIPHHRAALGMTEAILGETDRPAIERFAEAVSASQEAEISTMEEMLRQRGEKGPAGVPAGTGGADDVEGMDHHD